jgi:hypothetical protein
MAFLDLELIEELFSPAEKQEIITCLREPAGSVCREKSGSEPDECRQQAHAN